MNSFMDKKARRSSLFRFCFFVLFLFMFLFSKRRLYLYLTVAGLRLKSRTLFSASVIRDSIFRSPKRKQSWDSDYPIRLIDRNIRRNKFNLTL